MKAVLDIHEPESMYDLLEQNEDIESTMVAPLDAADIIIDGIGFERKTWDDYAASIKDGRLEDQDDKMSRFIASYIVVEGDLTGSDETYSSISGSSLRGHMASMTARDKYNVTAVIPCSNQTLLVDQAVRMARKHIEDPVSERLDTGAVSDSEPAGKRMWGCIPGVGPERAQALYERFGAPTNYAAATSRQRMRIHLTAMDGIGDKTAEKIIGGLWDE